MNRKNAGELVHANGMELSTTSSDTASFISAISSAVNGGGVYSRASRRDALSTVVVVAKLPRSDAHALDPGENASRDALALVRRDADSNFKSFPRRGASARASRISLAPSRRRRVTSRTTARLCGATRVDALCRRRVPRVLPTRRRRTRRREGDTRTVPGRPSVRDSTVAKARRDATTTRRDRARRDRASNGARATRREGANDRRATTRDVARDAIRARDSIRIRIGLNAMRSRATRFGERADDDATRTDESTTRE